MRKSGAHESLEMEIPFKRFKFSALRNGSRVLETRVTAALLT